MSSEKTSRAISVRLAQSCSNATDVKTEVELPTTVVPSTVERPLNIGGAEIMLTTKYPAARIADMMTSFECSKAVYQTLLLPYLSVWRHVLRHVTERLCLQVLV